MKWYMEYLIVWIITLLICFQFLTTPEDPLDLRLLITIVMGTLISASIYAGYNSTRKKTKKQ